MSGGGGTTQNTTRVEGLSDQQFNTLQGGQGVIRADIASVGNQAQTGLNSIRGDMNSGFSDLKTGVNNVNNTVGNLNNAVSTGFNTVGNQISGLGNDMTTKIGGLGSQIDMGLNNTNNNIVATGNALGSKMDTGFGNLEDTVNANTGAVLVNQNQGFADTRAAINTGFADNTANVNAKFDAQGNKIDAGFAGTANKLDTVQTNVLGGQANLKTLIEKYGGNLDRYYADLAASNADTTQRLGTLQTTTDNFRTDFNRDATLATQQRARIADSVAGGINAVREDLGNTQTALGTRIGGVAAQTSALQSQQAGATQDANRNFASIARNIAVGFSDNTEQSMADRNDFISRLNAIRTLAADPNVPVDDNTRAQYGELAQSFNAQGQLIARSVDANGISTARALDGQGSLLLAKFDPNGNRVGQQALNVNAMMQLLDQAGYRAPVAPTGIASPYYSTGA